MDRFAAVAEVPDRLARAGLRPAPERIAANAPRAGGITSRGQGNGHAHRRPRADHPPGNTPVRGAARLPGDSGIASGGAHASG